MGDEKIDRRSTGNLDGCCWCLEVASTMFCVSALNDNIQIYNIDTYYYVHHFL